MNTKKLITTSVAVTFAVIAAAAAPSAGSGAGATPLVVRGGLGHLVVRGDRVDVSYTVYSGSKAVRGDLYVRTDLQRAFARLALVRVKPPAVGLDRVVPARLLRGHRLFYYAVVRDPRSGRSVTLPAAGARAPSVAWILAKPLVTRLGAHQFGNTSTPEAVVARAGPGVAGFEDNEQYHFGPQTFLVGRDGSVWLHDGVNQRLIVWQAGQPDTAIRTVPLPFFAGQNDIGLGPGGSVYVTRLLRGGVPRLVLDRLSPAGKVLWEAPLGGRYAGESSFVLGSNSPVRIGPDGRAYCLVFMGRPGDEWGWMPVATAAGRPLSPEAQRRGTHWPFQPVTDGLRLVGGEVYTPKPDTAPHEIRYALIDRKDRVVRSWQIVSRTELNFHQTVPDLAGNDPVIVLDFASGASADATWEYEALRLGPHGVRAQVSLAKGVWGTDVLPDLRVGPDGKLYQLNTSPATGVVVSRYSLG